LIQELHVWMNRTLAKISRKSDTAAAILYALSRWRALTRYLDDRLIELDNSAAERALRAVAIGRKNFLLRDRIQMGSVPLASTHYSGQPSSTRSIQNSTFARCWGGLPITRSTALRSFFPGISRVRWSNSADLKCPSVTQMDTSVSAFSVDPFFLQLPS